MHATKFLAIINVDKNNKIALLLHKFFFYFSVFGKVLEFPFKLLKSLEHL